MFKRRRFPVEINLLCVRWYCKYGISYRDSVEMMQERGVEVDRSTIMGWVHLLCACIEEAKMRFISSTSWSMCSLSLPDRTKQQGHTASRLVHAIEPA